ncbi:MAG: hypothetical protein GTO45_24480 [Candidatus Aminicenantes bacterium]|nr:hypothetical protein [Candidatus Aminicenantes bacterium]NIM81911.1 hypothetical protein [Candidatus Aminicenantes bacterium]NIN21288.1 hypothetical protein [Candidatus Aminicenantes bacterium]NIN45109.1 hypothetical protein [Candidatus Aminicenantes bacterium]NIN87926.1 hypothetical protein [Candidatus Aminicenantes bacterium]
MTKHIIDNKDKGQADSIKSPKQIYKADEERPTSRRKRKIIMPIRKGTVSESAIRKAIRKVMANQPVSNET